MSRWICAKCGKKTRVTRRGTVKGDGFHFPIYHEVDGKMCDGMFDDAVEVASPPPSGDRPERDRRWS